MLIAWLILSVIVFVICAHGGAAAEGIYAVIGMAMFFLLVLAIASC